MSVVKAYQKLNSLSYITGDLGSLQPARIAVPFHTTGYLMTDGNKW
jgi:hypothetical protein